MPAEKLILLWLSLLFLLRRAHSGSALAARGIFFAG